LQISLEALFWAADTETVTDCVPRHRPTFEFVIVLIVLGAVGAILAWAMFYGHNEIVTHVLASISGLLGGYGIGRYKAAQQNSE
jgi:hypothetical protein